jgi:pilus assembly protein CpaD
MTQQTRFTSPALRRVVGGSVAITLALALAGCGGMPTNRSLDNLHQPVVEHTNYTFDMVTLPEGGLDPVQQRRLTDWFGAIGLKYGDHVALDDPAQASGTHAAVEAVAGRFGLVLDTVPPVTEGAIAAGQARVVISRAFASVPGCPDWQARSDANYSNATSRNYGCAVSSNLAAMVANKEDLIHGQDGNGNTVMQTNTKAIETYRAKAPTGGAALKAVSSTSGS